MRAKQMSRVSSVLLRDSLRYFIARLITAAVHAAAGIANADTETNTAQELLEPELYIQKCHSYGSLTSAIHQAYRGRLRSSS
jgi:hypothetical protein